METSALNANTMLDIYKLGTYYNPASTHYGEGKSVICDRCAKCNLTACIGYLNYDLCLSCADVVDRKANKSLQSTPMTGRVTDASLGITPRPISFDPLQVKSFMLQEQFRRTQQPLAPNPFDTASFMQQEQFRTSVQQAPRGSAMYDDYTQIQSDMQQDQFNSLQQSPQRGTSIDYSQVMSYMEQDQFDL